jgi:hypothetical protein
MRKLITTVAFLLLALLHIRTAIAQTTGGAGWSPGPANPTGSSSLTRDTRSVSGAPVGHRQPRASDVPSEDSNYIERVSPEDAALDRKISNICRGC